MRDRADVPNALVSQTTLYPELHNYLPGIGRVATRTQSTFQATCELCPWVSTWQLSYGQAETMLRAHALKHAAKWRSGR